MKKILFITLLVFSLFSCKFTSDEFPEKRNVNELKKTDFSPTLESSFDTQKNNIYAVTIPFAWNEIKNEIKTPLYDFESNSLKEVHQTKSHEKTLLKNEYKTSVTVDEFTIIARAYFEKTLSFKEPLTRYTSPLIFKNTKVNSFGFEGNSKIAKINYYNNDNDFSISLLPKNQDHEIILMLNNKKGINSFYSFWKLYSKKVNAFKNNKSIWKASFNENDKVEIPVVKFNLEKNFEKIIGSKFKSKEGVFEIDRFYQQNAFVLNEKGAKVKSFAEIALKEAVEELDLPKPKRMIFNKPFLIFLKRKDAKTPYFAVHVYNNEILETNN